MDLTQSLAGSDEENESAQFGLNSEGLRVYFYDRARKPIFMKDASERIGIAPGQDTGFRR